MLLNASVNVNGPLRFKHDVWAKGWVCMHVQLWIIVLLYGIAVGLFFVCDTEYFSFSSVWSLMLLLFFSMENKLCLNLFTSSYHFGYRCYMNKYMISTSEKKDFFHLYFVFYLSCSYLVGCDLKLSGLDKSAFKVVVIFVLR